MPLLVEPNKSISLVIFFFEDTLGDGDDDKTFLRSPFFLELRVGLLTDLRLVEWLLPLRLPKESVLLLSLRDRAGEKYLVVLIFILLAAACSLD